MRWKTNFESTIDVGSSDIPNVEDLKDTPTGDILKDMFDGFFEVDDGIDTFIFEIDPVIDVILNEDLSNGVSKFLENQSFHVHKSGLSFDKSLTKASKQKQKKQKREVRKNKYDIHDRTMGTYYGTVALFVFLTLFIVVSVIIYPWLMIGWMGIGVVYAIAAWIGKQVSRRNRLKSLNFL